MPIISIIVPVYKAEKDLVRCVDSILDQTYKDLEVILVDDGSPDNCGVICDSYAAKDPRVRVIHKENGGVSTARNAGLDVAGGDYIAFVDSDDYIDPDMYEKMMEKARIHDCDVVMCDCLKEFGTHSRLYTHEIRGGFYDADELRREHYPHLLMMENVEYPATISNCTILWKSSLNTPVLRYEPGVRFSEDLLFGAKLLRKATSFYYMKREPFYHYVMNPTSATHTYVSDKWKDYQHLHSQIQATFLQDSVFDFQHQIDLCLLFFVYNVIGNVKGTGAETRGLRISKIKEILENQEVRQMFDRLKIHSLPISARLKLITYLYKYNVGIGLLCWYFERK